MSTAPVEAARQWADANQRHLMAAVRLVTARIKAQGDSAAADQIAVADQAEREAAAALPAPSALQVIARRFGLSAFEYELLTLAAGVELDSACAEACAKAHGDARKPHATFNLALTALPGAHWSALTPAAPLRRWHLIEVQTGGALTTSPLRIDERVLHALAGVNYLDARLQGILRVGLAPVPLAPSHQNAAVRVRQLWDEHAADLVMLAGGDAAVKSSIVAAASRSLGCMLHVLPTGDLPTAPTERETLVRLIEREMALQNGALLIEIEDHVSSEAMRGAQHFAGSIRGLVAVSVREPSDGWLKPVHRVEVERPPTAEQFALWEDALGRLKHPLNGEIERVAGQFLLGPQAIAIAAGEATAAAATGELKDLGASLWESCRRLARARLDDLAQRIDSSATWEDLVLPDAQTAALREVAGQVRRRFQVYERWGFGSKLARGLGITTLFAGGSGTGKTMAAEVLAHDLRLDLYRIDLSSVVSKYVGETEKNLRRVFDAAEAGGAILLFDEADALFGKRSEVRDSHDRYANIEVSYLLQRMEAYRGLAILTTNMKSVLDAAFMRRLRFVVQFPFPDQAQRERIWRRVFPQQMPIDAVKHARLAQLNVPGGNIRNIALNAAFLAAEDRGPVGMRHLLAAARSEYAKMEKPLTESEIGGWA